MDRRLLSQIIRQMKVNMKNGESIGDMKLSSLLALGHQLEAIAYFIGHELGTTLSIGSCEIPDIPAMLEKVAAEYHIGKLTITEKTEEIIQLKLESHSSIKDLVGTGIKTESNFCSFEAGMLAGIVEKMSSVHVFAQELNCGLQTGKDYCDFMIVFQKD